MAEASGQDKLHDLCCRHIKAVAAQSGGHTANKRMKTGHGLCGWANATGAISENRSADVANQIFKKCNGFAQ